MSLSLLERLTLFVHPRRLMLERRSWRGAVLHQTAEVARPASGEADWQPALKAAEALLATSGRGAGLRIVVADHFVRYALLPWSEEISGKTARLALARALLKNALGDKAAALDIALDRPAFGRNGLAAGIDSQLLAGLRAAARARHLRLGSLQPRLIAEMATRHRQLADGWFVCLEPGWLSLVGLVGGEITSLRNHRANTGDPASLAGELDGLLVAARIAPEAGDKPEALAGNKVFVASRAVPPPQLAGGWEMTCWPPVVGGEAHA